MHCSLARLTILMGKHKYSVSDPASIQSRILLCCNFAENCFRMHWGMFQSSFWFEKTTQGKKMVGKAGQRSGVIPHGRQQSQRAKGNLSLNEKQGGWFDIRQDKTIPPFALPTLLGSLPAMLGRGAASLRFVSSLRTHSLSAVPLLLHCWLQQREPVGVRNQPAPVAGGQGEVRSWWSMRKVLELKPDGEIKNRLWPAFLSTKLIVLLVTTGKERGGRVSLPLP